MEFSPVKTAITQHVVCIQMMCIPLWTHERFLTIDNFSPVYFSQRDSPTPTLFKFGKCYIKQFYPKTKSELMSPQVHAPKRFKEPQPLVTMTTVVTLNI